MPPKTNATILKNFEIPKLNGKGNWEQWWGLIEDLTYSANMADFWAAGLQDLTDEEQATELTDIAAAPVNTLPRRQELWGLLRSRMEEPERRKVQSVAKGHVEGLLRMLRKTYEKKNEISLDRLRRQYDNAQLEDYTDFATYKTEIEFLANKMTEQGEAKSTGNMRYRLLEGLPSDWNSAAQSLRLPQMSDLTWSEIIAYLEDFAETNPSIVGSGARGTTGTESTHATTTECAHATTTTMVSEEICRNFSLAGKCLNGDRCGYRHVNNPHSNHRTESRNARSGIKCTHCGKMGHMEAKCYSKHGVPAEVQAQWDARRRHQNKSNNSTIKEAIFAALSEYNKKAMATTTETEDNGNDAFVFCATAVISSAAVAVARNNTASGLSTQIMLDGGSTRHVTTDATDCIDVVSCDIDVKVGGGVLKCTRMGTWIHRCPAGAVRLRGSLIIPSFGLKIVAEAPFLLKGCGIYKFGGMATIVSGGNTVLNCPINAKGLAFLPPPTGISQAEASAIVKKSKVARALAREATEEKFREKFQGPQNFQDFQGTKFQGPQNFQDFEGPQNSFGLDPAALAYPARSYTEADTLLDWHCRLGHRNFDDVARHLRRAGIPFKTPSGQIFCQACVEGKACRHPLSYRTTPLLEAPRPGFLLHSDVAGPFNVTTRSGKRYFKVLIDGSSRRLWVSLLSSLTEAFPKLKDEIRAMEAEKGHSNLVAQFHADGATYFEKSTAMKQFLTAKGITALYSPPHTPELNGVAERTIRTLLEMTLCMLFHAKAPSYLWGEAILYAAFLLNHLPYKSGSTLTRMEKWDNKQAPSQYVLPSTIHTWGCSAWVYVDAAFRGKLDPKAEKYIFLGWDARRQAYRLGALPGYKLKFSAHVIFQEDDFPCRSIPSTAPHVPFTSLTAPPANTPANTPARHLRAWTPSAAALRHIANGTASPPGQEAAAAAIVFDDVNLPTLTVSDFEECFAAIEDVTAGGRTDPRSYDEALVDDDAPSWMQAVDSEIKSHTKNGTFGKPITKAELQALGKRCTPLGDVWKTKRCSKKKYRVVVRGYLLRAGIDFNSTFASVAYVTTLRALFALAAKFDWEIKQGDVATAFLQSDMDTEVYVTLPKAFRERSKTAAMAASQGRIYYRLLKGVPGIPQGSRLFSKKFHTAITAVGLTRSKVDYSLYFAANNIYLVIWVDDLFFFFPSSQTSTAKLMWAGLQERLDLADWSDIDDCLGCKVQRDRPTHTLTLTQTDAINELVAKVGLSNANPVDTPCVTGFVFTKADCPQTEEERMPLIERQKKFRSELMSCIYFSNWSRPDITFTISKLAKFMHNPGPKHEAALKRLLRYLAGTSSRGLTYSFASPPTKTGIYGYYDAAFADDVDTRRSTMGFTFFFEGCLLSWMSKLHTYVTTSSNHSEYCGASKAAREAKMLKMLMTELNFPDTVSPIDLFSDSQGATAMCYNPVNRNASKHIDLADHYVREQVERHTITVSYVSTKDMLADALTKSLPKAQFFKLMDIIMGLAKF
jgi:transposase InsO family protein